MTGHGGDLDLNWGLMRGDLQTKATCKLRSSRDISP